MVASPVMTRVWCSLVYCILRWIFCIRFCTAKHLLSLSLVCLSCSCGSSTLSLGVSLSVGVSLPSPQSTQDDEYRYKPSIAKGLTATPKASRIRTHWIGIKIGVSSFPSNPLALMNSGLWAPRDAGGCSLWLAPPAVFQDNRGNGQERSGTAPRHNALQPVWQLFLLPPLSGYCGPVCKPVRGNWIAPAPDHCGFFLFFFCI